MLLLKGKRRLLTLLASMLAMTLSGCEITFGSSSSDIPDSSDSSAPSSSESPSDDSSSYSRDENGFKDFDPSYFVPVNDPNDKKEKNQVKFSDYVDGMELYPKMKMYVAGEEVPVYKVNINENRTWKADAGVRVMSAYATIAIKGKVKISLQCAFNPLQDVVIRPLGKNVPYEIDSARWVISFDIDSPGQYLIETRQRTLHLFVNEIKDEDISNCIVFKRGIHTKDNDSRINSNNEITIHSNEHIYLEDGAVVRAKFVATDASNFSIKGPGIIDGSTFPRNPNEGTATIPLDFNFCSNFTLEDFSIMDPAGWAYNIYFANGVTIKNTKIMSSRSNGDGISIQSCNNVNVEGCFLRTWDDSLVVKNYVNWRTQAEGSTSGVHFSDCLIVTDLAQCMEVGYETIGEKMEDISFSNITVLHAFHKPVMSIHNGNNAKIRNVRYENITVEDASMGRGDGNPYLFDFDVSYSPTWSDNHKKTGLGDIDGVDVSNVLVLSGYENPKVKVTGSMETRDGYTKEAHYVKNVHFKNVSVLGEAVDGSYAGYVNSYAQGVTFENTAAATGATYTKPDISSYGNNVERVK